MAAREVVRLDERLALSIGEAARALGISDRHLRAQMSRIPHIHLGRRVLIPVDVLRRWLTEESHREAARANEIADEIFAKFLRSPRKPRSRRSITTRQKCAVGERPADYEGLEEP